jgi:hypothetical protein
LLICYRIHYKVFPVITETQTEIIAGGGLWRDVSCLARQLVVCQKFQTWSVPKIQTTLMKIRSNLEFEIANKSKIFSY